MKKLILTSNGFENPKIGKNFLDVFGKDPEEIKLLFIPIASRTEEELYYVEESRKELFDLGIKKENIKDYNLDREIDDEELNDFDSIYVCGGNTFYLLHILRENGFDKKIINMVNNGIVYVGVSAGSILVGPNVEISGIDVSWDKNDVGLKDTFGLNLIDKIISPHYTKKEEKIIKQYEKEKNVKVLRLKDNQALLILGDKEEILE